jgi:hypothetical protein
VFSPAGHGFVVPKGAPMMGKVGPSFTYVVVPSVVVVFGVAVRAAELFDTTAAVWFFAFSREGDIVMTAVCVKFRSCRRAWVGKDILRCAEFRVCD